MIKAAAACLAALLFCSACIFDDEFWEDCYDCGYEDEYEDDYFALPTPPSTEPLAARPR